MFNPIKSEANSLNQNLQFTQLRDLHANIVQQLSKEAKKQGILQEDLITSSKFHQICQNALAMIDANKHELAINNLKAVLDHTNTLHDPYLNDFGGRWVVNSITHASMVRCKLILGWVESAYRQAIDQNWDIDTYNYDDDEVLGLNELRLECKTAIHNRLHTISEMQGSLVELKNSLAEAVRLCDLIGIDLTPELKRFEQKIDWLERAEGVNQKFTRLQELGFNVVDAWTYRRDIEDCRRSYESNYEYLSETERKNLTTLIELSTAETVRKNRDEIRENLQAFYNFLQTGNLVEAHRYLGHAVNAAKELAATGTELQDYERPEHIEASFRILDQALRIFKSRAFHEGKTLAIKIIDRALEIKTNVDLRKVLSSSDRVALTRIISNQLDAYWYKFDQREASSYAQTIERLSEDLSEQLAWTCCYHPAMLFRQPNLYVASEARIVDITQTCLHHFIQTQKPPILGLPILMSAFFTEFAPIQVAEAVHNDEGNAYKAVI